MEDAVITTGTVAHPGIVFTDEPGYERPFVILQVLGAPGNSGSPVLNLRGEIVSVAQIGWGQGFGAIMGGVEFETLAKYRGVLAVSDKEAVLVHLEYIRESVDELKAAMKDVVHTSGDHEVRLVRLEERSPASSSKSAVWGALWWHRRRIRERVLQR